MFDVNHNGYSVFVVSADYAIGCVYCVESFLAIEEEGRGSGRSHGNGLWGDQLVFYFCFWNSGFGLFGSRHAERAFGEEGQSGGGVLESLEFFESAVESLSRQSLVGFVVVEFWKAVVLQSAQMLHFGCLLGLFSGSLLQVVVVDGS